MYHALGRAKQLRLSLRKRGLGTVVLEKRHVRIPHPVHGEPVRSLLVLRPLDRIDEQRRKKIAKVRPCNLLHSMSRMLLG